MAPAGTLAQLNVYNLVCFQAVIDPSFCHYRSRRLGRADLEHRISEICRTRMRYGFRQLRAFFSCNGPRGFYIAIFFEGVFTHDEFVRRHVHFMFTPDFYACLQLMEMGAPVDAAARFEIAVAANPAAPKFHLSLFEAGPIPCIPAS